MDARRLLFHITSQFQTFNLSDLGIEASRARVVKASYHPVTSTSRSLRLRFTGSGFAHRHGWSVDGTGELTPYSFFLPLSGQDTPVAWAAEAASRDSADDITLKPTRLGRVTVEVYEDNTLLTTANLATNPLTFELALFD